MADALSAFRGLLAGSHQARPEDLPALGRRAAELLDAWEVTIYLVDYGQVNLVPLAGAGTPAPEVELVSPPISILRIWSDAP